MYIYMFYIYICIYVQSTFPDGIVVFPFISPFSDEIPPAKIKIEAPQIPGR